MLSILYRLSCVMAVFVVIDAINKEERQTLLDCHNYRRAQLALGKYSGQPAAADMTLMDYDLKIEGKAQYLSTSCAGGHDKNKDRLVSEYPFLTAIGQNAAWNSGSNAIQSGCNGWWNEYKDYDYAANTGNGKVVGHYTQMAWTDSTVIGCGVRTDCTNKWKANAFCNYANAGNYQGVKPYKQGPACSQCPDGYNMCMDNALCARPDQCKAASGANCKCALTSCQNGGTLNGDCTCSCKDGFFGGRCQNECKDTKFWCSYSSMKCDNSYYLKVCQKQCKQCKNKTPFISKDTGGIIARVKQEGSGNSGSGKDDSGKDDSGKDDSGKDDSGKDDSGKKTTKKPLKKTAKKIGCKGGFCNHGGRKICVGKSFIVVHSGYKFKCTCGQRSCVYLGTV